MEAKVEEQGKELARLKKQMSTPWLFNRDNVDPVMKNRARIILGEGSSASVYLATFKGYQVAVKEVKRAVAGNPKHPEIFKSEVELHFRLHQHPGICKVVGAWSTFDPTENILPSIVLEYLPISFNDVISRPSVYDVTVAKMLDILLSLASVLSFLHEQKLGHNDFKPENVMMSADKTPKVLDFGDAKERRLASISLSRMSKTDVRGTVGFMVFTNASYCSLTLLGP